MQPPITSPLRLARPSDIKRLGIVIVSGFYFSPTFQWYRRYHAAYPSDTLSSYRSSFADWIKSPNHIVLVAVDKFDANESEKSLAVIPENEKQKDLSDGDEVVVGVAVWVLEEGSKRIGQYQPDIENFPDIQSNSNRDIHPEQHRLLLENNEARLEYFQNSSELDILVVHPAYWGKAHGRTLVQWGLDFAKIDGVPQGVTGPDKGVKLYKALGFKYLADLELKGNDVAPEGLRRGVLKYELYFLKDTGISPVAIELGTGTTRAREGEARN